MSSSDTSSQICTNCITKSSDWFPTAIFQHATEVSVTFCEDWWRVRGNNIVKNFKVLRVSLTSTTLAAHVTPLFSPVLRINKRPHFSHFTAGHVIETSLHKTEFLWGRQLKFLSIPRVQCPCPRVQGPYRAFHFLITLPYGLPNQMLCSFQSSFKKNVI
jgi:hypothetical protein